MEGAATDSTASTGEMALSEIDDILAKARDMDNQLLADLAALTCIYGIETVKEIIEWSAQVADSMGPNEFEWVAIRLRSLIDF